MAGVADKIIEFFMGSKHEREVKRLLPRVQRINALEPELAGCSDDELRARLGRIRDEVRAALAELPEEYRERRELVQGVLGEHLEEVFALVREASKRTLGMRHFDVQLIGGMVLHEGMISEMRTGEGKTLVATLPVVLNAITGRGVHVVTVNDYLAKRDAEWMGRIYQFLGLSVGCIQNQMVDTERFAAYRADITYGTNNEFGFDYLRDNMKFDVASMVQRGHIYAIVDEVDSILVDEARTPLIISGPSELSIGLYYQVDRIIPKLIKGEEIRDKYGNKSTTGDYIVDEKSRTSALTEEGVAKAERLLSVSNLYDPTQIEVLHAVEQALRAHALYQRDREYIVKDGQVIIVDEFTGRLMPGRRWSDGLHQAVEAKEGVKIEAENQTLATITLQNYFRMYEKLAGMTGTAETEADEFAQIYGLDVIVIPTNKPMVRADNPDLIYRTEKEKWKAVVEEILELHEKGQPILVGTVSIEKSEKLSELLKRRGIQHVVLNAKFHEREAAIVAQAGRFGAVTIATNMAGRGTDIILGGNPEGLAKAEVDPLKDPEAYQAALARYTAQCGEGRDKVLAAGGLHILGTERHEARRIDNQLRGRSGRQGDSGSSRFILSLEDDLMRIFASDRLREWMKHLGMEEDVPIESKMVTRSIERAQKQVEGRNFEIRKHLLQYDDVMNKQRESVYRLRRDVLSGKEGREWVLNASRQIIGSLIDTHCPDDKHFDDWDQATLDRELEDNFGLGLQDAGVAWDKTTRVALEDQLVAAVEARYAAREQELGEEDFRQLERYVILSVLDAQWKDHLLALDHLKEGIGMRAYGQRDPLVEYKRESFGLFQSMMDRIEDQAVQYMFKLELSRVVPDRRRAAPVRESKAEASALQGERQEAKHSPGSGSPTTVRRQEPKVGRNDPCPCGSGKKYKKCHGASEGAAAS
ncbi:MAG: preprotein translocase subunit SecA [Thermoanaerobaculaceae bacterium]|nr:preprotein translocase subunit SecA [Thermoanaerobaculaceae bacterium]MDI9621426.1 preprotein translocase subunit SecA [Acidobacteriota bacterium]NLH12325.1 preprotein translocase subunit SecA [Holophagae bacterium]HPW55475.1 preprotein translocase subunit SecA [Thermoanaerobaculaceae bacterium]